MAVYLVIENGEAVNRIEWDGVTPYDPGEGRVLVPEAEAPPEIPPVAAAKRSRARKAA